MRIFSAVLILLLFLSPISYSDQISSVEGIAAESGFITAANRLKQIEGGYSDHPADSGGPTTWGISEWMARAYGFEGDMKDLPWEKARDIYYLEYWTRNHYDKIKDPDIAVEMMDQALNLPYVWMIDRIVLKANVHLQRAYNLVTDGEPIAVDGIIGPETLNAVNTCPEIILLYNVLNGFQASHYLRIAENNPALRDFIAGWFAQRIEYRKK